MVERSLLLALMRRLRRRRRWMAAVQGAAVAVALAGPVLALATVLLWRLTGKTPGAGLLGAALLTVAGIGAGARAARRISLTSCARSVDRALGVERSGDCVLAAVALVEASPAPTAFVAAVTSDAVARARQVSAARAAPWPARRALLSAVAGVGVLAAVGLLPAARSRASTVVKPGIVTATGATQVANDSTPAPPIQLPGPALEAEREDAHRAALAAREAADTTLGGLADEFERLLSDLSGDGLPAAAAISRLTDLTNDAQGATDSSKVAAAAARAGTAALKSARDVGSDGAALAEAITAATGATATATAGEAARRLAARDDQGRAALAEAVAAAGAAMAAGGGGTSPGATDRGDGNDGERRRRLQSPSDSPRSTDPAAPGAGGTRDQQRRLQQLRRDLEQTAADCRKDPQACRQNADQAGRSLADLQRQGRTAEARQRLAEAARQLLDRLRRGGGTSDARDQLRRFARAARGATSGNNGSDSRDGKDNSGGDRSQDPGAGQSPVGVALGEAGETGEPGDGDSSGPSGPQDEGGAGTNGGAQQTDGEGAGAAVAGGGIGSEPGGPVLGARTPGGGPGGRDTPARVRDDPAGPSRAAVIGGAAARGFASTGYRRVFDDYHAAVEESLDATVVPPGRRYLVRRYFQLIRPRTP